MNGHGGIPAITATVKPVAHVLPSKSVIVLRRNVLRDEAGPLDLLITHTRLNSNACMSTYLR